MASGTVKFFNMEKGFGFITPDEGGNDVFVHITAVKDAGLNELKDKLDLLNSENASLHGKVNDMNHEL